MVSLSVDAKLYMVLLQYLEDKGYCDFNNYNYLYRVVYPYVKGRMTIESELEFQIRELDKERCNEDFTYCFNFQKTDYDMLTNQVTLMDLKIKEGDICQYMKYQEFTVNLADLGAEFLNNL